LSNPVRLCPTVFFKEEFYNEFARPQGQHNSIGCVLNANGSKLTLIGFHRPGSKAIYMPEEFSLLEKIKVHLQKAIKISQQLNQSDYEAKATLDTLNVLKLGIILVNRSGKPVFVNQMANEIINKNDCLHIFNGKIHATLPNDTAQLSRLINQAISNHISSAGNMLLKYSESNQPLCITVIPIKLDRSEEQWPDIQEVSAALFFNDPYHYVKMNQAMLQEIYSLTRAEARLAMELANGRSMEYIADRFNLSKHTVRAQLKSCFRKTAATHQAELVKLILTTPSVFIMQ
jgi:DNA-binding CsgD family transcriptional regulator